MHVPTPRRTTAVLGLVSAALLSLTTPTALTAAQPQPARDTVSTGQLVIARVIPGSGEDTNIYTLNPDGSHRHLVTPKPVQCPRWSPDGRLIATCGLPPNGATAILDPDTGTVVRRIAMPDPTLFISCPVWKPGMRWLACEGFGNRRHPGRNGIYALRISDAHLARVTRIRGGDDIPGSYSPDGRHLVLSRNKGDVGRLAVVRSDGTRLRILTAAGHGVSSSGDWSTHGNRIVFSRHVTDEVHSTLWVMRADGSGLHPLVPGGRHHFCGGKLTDPHTRGCTGPTWSPNDARIAFVRETNRDHQNIWVVNVDGTGLRQVTHAKLDVWVDWGTHPLVR